LSAITDTAPAMFAVASMRLADVCVFCADCDSACSALLFAVVHWYSPVDAITKVTIIPYLLAIFCI